VAVHRIHREQGVLSSAHRCPEGVPCLAIRPGGRRGKGAGAVLTRIARQNRSPHVVHQRCVASRRPTVVWIQRWPARAHSTRYSEVRVARIFGPAASGRIRMLSRALRHAGSPDPYARIPGNGRCRSDQEELEYGGSLRGRLRKPVVERLPRKAPATWADDAVRTPCGWSSLRLKP